MSAASTDPGRRVSSRLTALALNVGSIVSAASFLVGVVLDAFGRSGGDPDPLQPAAIVAAVAGLEAWGWATLGVAALIATPALGLVATALEYRSIDRRSSLLALVVLGVLGTSLAVALVR
jgi:uncharacterized membrane protein